MKTFRRMIVWTHAVFADSQQIELKYMFGATSQRKKHGENTKSWRNVFGDEKKNEPLKNKR